MDVRVGPQRKLSAQKLMLSNCGAGEEGEMVGWQHQLNAREFEQTGNW